MDERQDRIVEIRAGAEDLRRLGLVDRAELQDRLADELQRRLDQPAVGLTEPGAWTVTESRRRQLAEELAILRRLEDAARLTPHAVLEELAVLDDESASPVAERDSAPWFPTRKKTIEEWAGVYYDAIKPLARKYMEEYQEVLRDEPNPSTEDYLDAIAAHLGEKRKARYLRNVKRAGEEGWLEPYYE